MDRLNFFQLHCVKETASSEREFLLSSCRRKLNAFFFNLKVAAYVSSYLFKALCCVKDGFNAEGLKSLNTPRVFGLES
jgi:hypothetical protein